jgi:elongation factor P--beta-lysine ligase
MKKQIDLQPFFIREQIVKAIREFFYEKHFHEIITPVFNDAVPAEPNIYPFQTVWQSARDLKTLYLSTSPEAKLKMMLGAGVGNCFSIAKCFRNLEGVSPIHNPEFLMLEWYRKKADYQVIMDEVRDLILFINKIVNKGNTTILYQGKKIDLRSKWPCFSLIDLFKKYANLQLPEILSDERMKEVAGQKGYSVENASWEQLFNQIFLNEIEPHIPYIPCFITDYPSRISFLCTSQKENYEFSQRFELYMAGIELANGNTENTDIKSIRTVFLEENRKRKKMSGMLPLDEEFFESIRNMSDATFAGVGLGIDRLSMIFSNKKNIHEVDPLTK